MPASPLCSRQRRGRWACLSGPGTPLPACQVCKKEGWGRRGPLSAEGLPLARSKLSGAGRCQMVTKFVGSVSRALLLFLRSSFFFQVADVRLVCAGPSRFPEHHTMQRCRSCLSHSCSQLSSNPHFLSHTHRWVEHLSLQSTVHHREPSKLFLPEATLPAPISVCCCRSGIRELRSR